MKKITRAWVEKMQTHLLDYVNEWSKVDRSMKFQCFNKRAHSHDDHTPSAAIVPDSFLKYWTCFSCGAKGDIFKAVEIWEGISSFYERAVFLSKKYNEPLEFGKERKQSTPKITAEYPYQDERNKTQYKILRREWCEKGKRKKAFIAYSRVGERWEKGLGNRKRYLYNLPGVLKAIEAGEFIFFVEGEKCVHTILELGLVGTISCSILR